MISEIREVIKEELNDHEILSFEQFVRQVNRYTRKHLKSCDGFSIWSVLAIRDKTACIYTQDSKAKIKFYDPVNETLNDMRKN